MTLIDKESLLPVRVEGRRRSTRLTTEDGTVDSQSAVLYIEDDDGAVHRYLQNKWRTSLGWSMFIVDDRHSLVAIAGPRRQEGKAWQDCARILSEKGLWRGKLPS